MMSALRRYFSLISRNDQRNNLELIIFITNRCNARCEHCFYASEINKDAPDADLDYFKKLALRLPRNCNKITFSGGEPFLREDFPEIVDIFIHRGINEFSVATNGILTERIIKFAENIYKIKNVKLELAVSLDGPEEIHDKIRRHEGAFRKAFATLKILKDKGVNVVVQTVISGLNFDEIERFDQYVYSNLKTDIHYQFIRGAEISGLPENLRRSFNPLDLKLLPSQEDMQNFLDAVRRVYINRIRKRKEFLKNVFNFTVLECRYLINKKKKRLFPCMAGKGVFVLYPSTEVALCEYMKPVDKKLQDCDFNGLFNSSDFLAKQKIAKTCYCTHGCFIKIVGTLRFLLRFINNACSFALFGLKTNLL